MLQMTAARPERDATPVRGLPVVILNSLPKAGTHLLARTLGGLAQYAHAGFDISEQSADGSDDPDSTYIVGVGNPRHMAAPAFEALIGRLRPATFILAHLPFTLAAQALLERREIRMILILRDPRDVACSLAHYVVKTPAHRLHARFSGLPDVTARIRASIKGLAADEEMGLPGLRPLEERMESLLGWLQWPGAHAVAFEHLVGEPGGGTSALQDAALAAILAHIGLSLPAEARVALRESLYCADSPTFRQGRAGAWRQHFTPELESLFAERAGAVLNHYLSLAGTG